MFAVKPFRELRSAISVERLWRGLSLSRAVGAWSLAARRKALREVNDRRHIYLGSSGIPLAAIILAPWFHRKSKRKS
jgi:hypothetical protein